MNHHDLMVRIIGKNQTKAAADETIRDLNRIDGAANEVARTMSRPVAARGAFGANASFRLQNLAFQTNDIVVGLSTGQRMQTVMMQQGAQILQLYAGQGGIKTAFADIGKLAGGVARVLAGPLALGIGAVGLGFAGLTTKINETAETQVSFGNVVVATMQLAAEGIGKFFAPAINQLQSWWQGFVDWLAPVIKGLTNTVTGYFDLQVRNIKSLWHGLPNALGDIMITAANNVIAAVENMVNGVIGGLNNLFNEFALWRARIGKPLSPKEYAGLIMSPTTLGRFENPYAGAAGDLAKQFQKNRDDVAGTDYGGQLFGAISEHAQAIAKATQQTADSAGKSLGKLGDASKAAAQKVSDAWDFARNTFTGFFTSIGQGLRDGSSLWDAFGKSAISALGSISDRLLQLGANSLFNSLFGLSSPGNLKLGYNLGGSATGGLLGGAIIPGILHGGGMAGRDGYGHSRAFPAAMWAGAERFHDGSMGVGLKPNEIPAILERGERVIPANQNTPAAANGNGVTVNISVDARGAQQGVGAEIARALDDFSRNQLPDRVQDIQSDPHGRG